MQAIVSWIRECDAAAFTQVFQSYPELQLLNARTEPVPWDSVSGLLLTGGSDISADFLRQPIPDPSLIIDPESDRDAWEFTHLKQALAQDLPILAICRGLQVLNVALGGTLHLDVPNHDSHKYLNQQPLTYSLPTELQFPLVNSSHHQALDQLGTGLVVEARCTLDGVIEQAHLTGYRFVLGVQYHPERDPLYRPLFDAFAAAVTGEK